MEPIFRYSRVVNLEEATGSFTTLEVRINSRDDIANTSTRELITNWRKCVEDSNDIESSSCLSELGNWCSFVFPESKPQRLAILTYLTNLGFLHDGELMHLCFRPHN